jgi:hypothetical protein
VPEQVIRRDHYAPVTVVEDRVRGTVAGAVVHVLGAVAEAHLLAVVQDAGHVGPRAPSARSSAPRTAAQRATDSEHEEVKEL